MSFSGLPYTLSSVNKIISALCKCLTSESSINDKLETLSDNNWHVSALLKFWNSQPEEGTNSCSSAETLFLKSVHDVHWQSSFADPHFVRLWLQQGSVPSGSHREGTGRPKFGAFNGNFFAHFLSSLCKFSGNPLSFLILRSCSRLWSTSVGCRSERFRYIPFLICLVTSTHRLWL